MIVGRWYVWLAALALVFASVTFYCVHSFYFCSLIWYQIISKLNRMVKDTNMP